MSLKSRQIGKRDGTSQHPGLRLRAWIELPFFLGASHTERFEAEYRPGVPVRLQLQIRHDLRKVVTGNYWLFEQELRKAIDRKKGGDQTPLPAPVMHARYVREEDLELEAARLRADPRIPYVHIEKLWTVLEIQGQFGEHLTSKTPNEFDVDLLPGVPFFATQVIPRIRNVVDAYRIAVLPAMRYGVLPVADALFHTAFMEIQRETGKAIQQWTYGFGSDPFFTPQHMHLAHGSKYGLQERFETALINLMRLEPENQFGAAYYLFGMGRQSEAVAIASSVVDGLANKLVQKRAKPALAKTLWRLYRNRYVDLFKDLFPGLGLPSLVRQDPELWQSFVAAKKYRGNVMHGGAPSTEMFDHAKSALGAFYGVARWLSVQLGRGWALDHPSAQDLNPFPRG